MTDSNKYLTA